MTPEGLFLERGQASQPAVTTTPPDPEKGGEGEGTAEQAMERGGPGCCQTINQEEL